MALLKTLGVIGDIHAEDRLLERAIATLAAQGAEKIVATGDVADGTGDIERCCALLEEHGVDTVRGNHDRWLTRGTMRDLPHAHLAHQLGPRTQDFLRLLAPTITYETAAGRLLLCHGIGPDDMSTVMPHTRDQDLGWIDPLQRIIEAREIDVLVAGHSHHAMSRRVGRLWLINGGTLCADQSPCCVLVRLDEGRAEIIDLKG